MPAYRFGAFALSASAAASPRQPPPSAAYNATVSLNRAARAWITEYPSDALPKAEAVYAPNIYQGMADYGIVALYQKCPHLGCRVPSCATSGWFECPCHGSQYNRVGEKKAGPAPRGMDRFPATIGANGDVTIDTGKRVTGPAIGVNTTGQEAEGPHCTGGGEH
jgi:cytochrome b6-f complex iron-sulfur subunit